MNYQGRLRKSNYDLKQPADRIAKLCAKDEQEEKAVSSTEIKMIPKYLLQDPPDTRQLLTATVSRPDQITIFRLRTGHNRHLQHLMHKKLHAMPYPMCPCFNS